MGRGGGNGPSLFEFNLRATAWLGTTAEFEVPEATYFADPADPEIAVPEEPYIANPDEPEVVVLGVTPRRPNTRASMTRQREHINEVMQHCQAIEEQVVDERFWHLSRINQGGHPSCNAVMVGRNAPKAFCKTRIKSSGLSMHVHRISSTMQQAQDFPSIVDIHINVDLYAQKVQSVLSTFRFNSKGQKTCRRKTMASTECLKRLQYNNNASDRPLGSESREWIRENVPNFNTSRS
ncbi:hypothetical protein R1sor_012628 [Riccia sorocarpa]|uniref:Uncharacterized protein n=1 Tax=Riccia sorocarpa TaxID=122646 RepID=A0ABD3I4B3_9MARC